MEDDAERLELGEALVERLLGLVLVVGQVVQVGEPEMAGVGEAGAHHPPIAGGDRRPAVARDQVRDQDEAVGEPAVRPLEHEALLVGADRGPDDLGRDVEKIGLEFAHEHDGPFDEARDLLDQALVLDQLQTLREGQRPRVLADDRLAPVGVEHDLGLQQRIDIVLVAADGDRSGRHEAVAPGDVSRG